MQIRTAKAGQSKIEQQTTPLIDVVFQLLVFFVMSFKVVSLEGDFNLKLPLSGRGPESTLLSPPDVPLKLRMIADSEGRLASLALNEQAFAASDWPGVQRYLLQLMGTASGPGSLRNTLEVELDCDYGLRYDYAIAAITAISGTRSTSGEIVPLVERVKFSPPRRM